MDFDILMKIAKWLVMVIGLSGLGVGMLSFFKPEKSIRFYQILMQQINWRVEPIHWERELRNTKRLGGFTVFLSFAIIWALLMGCASVDEPWGYRSAKVSGVADKLLRRGSRDPLFGFISDEKLNVVKQYGIPDFLAKNTLLDTSRGIVLEEWIYIQKRKRFLWTVKEGQLNGEENLSALDLAAFEGYVQPQMNREQIKIAKGKPDSIQYHAQEYGASEKWIYRRYSSDDVYYFDQNGLLMMQRSEKNDAAGDGLSRDLGSVFRE
ncbi:MAG: hypothetical protein COV74_08485 [Candidatus Omnitrophica bacterium CG11_big_fil_rev_8_21_14_0_20_45_26]|uniref:Uncharacterized protein n=1 Tax=Candidatus Abzuiibacterium crystallinum TaxID=1974748 RepID=A0A2H0LMD4_9BACT|nr:MAG: hypothetical protein COV74_08485 [Candidatus Omnitrophica bacterium CG11_big_fil_rev_8_21_14_0_20_45_26]PIW63698.1 MAG: hypothetical protein COW12_09370 [Candidatus Omnitrophica bacterium CG12_big_fil_rev_8_21_14_0_65_45_16]